jgi:hypothetical protein
MQINLQRNGAGSDVSAAESVVLEMRHQRTSRVMLCQPEEVNAESGQFRQDFSEQHTAVKGVYLLKVTATYADGSVEIYPSKGHGLLEVT